MNTNYCLPIIEGDPTLVLATIRDNIDEYSYFEVWLDHILDFDDDFVPQLQSLLGERLIVLFRRQNLEAIQLPMDRRTAIMLQLSGSNSLLDLDVATQTSELEFIRNENLQIQLITSYHNYKSTPDPLRLKGIIATMELHRPRIYKVSTYCNSHSDALILLGQLIDLKLQQKSTVMLGMGEMGAVTRIFGTLWGNEMAFAPLSAEQASAPGQLTRDQMQHIFKELGY